MKKIAINVDSLKYYLENKEVVTKKRCMKLLNHKFNLAPLSIVMVPDRWSRTLNQLDRSQMVDCLPIGLCRSLKLIVT